MGKREKKTTPKGWGQKGDVLPIGKPDWGRVGKSDHDIKKIRKRGGGGKKGGTFTKGGWWLVGRAGRQLEKEKEKISWWWHCRERKSEGRIDSPVSVVKNHEEIPTQLIQRIQRKKVSGKTAFRGGKLRRKLT